MKIVKCAYKGPETEAYINILGTIDLKLKEIQEITRTSSSSSEQSNTILSFPF